MRTANPSLLKIILSLTIPTVFLLIRFQKSPNRRSYGSRRTHNELTLVRAFPTWKSSPDNLDWCIPSSTQSNKKSTTSGLLYVKTPKTGSSSLAGAMLRIAHRNGLPGHPCAIYYDHTEGRTFRNRFSDKSFLIASVREPKQRALSHVFFDYVSRGGMEPTDQNIIDKLKFFLGARAGDKVWAGYQVNYLSMREAKELIITNQDFDRFAMRQIVSEIVHDYDFLIVSDRMDESLVALHFLLGVELTDVIYLPAKVNGGYDDGLGGKCTKIEKPFASPKVTEFLESKNLEWNFVGDTMLYHVANMCLDRTINEIGHQEFDSKLNEYRELMELANEKCAREAIFPCSANGVRQQLTNCYWNDSGCGYPCLDEFSDSVVNDLTVT